MDERMLYRKLQKRLSWPDMIDTLSSWIKREIMLNWVVVSYCLIKLQYGSNKISTHQWKTHNMHHQREMISSNGGSCFHGFTIFTIEKSPVKCYSADLFSPLGFTVRKCDMRISIKSFDKKKFPASCSQQL